MFQIRVFSENFTCSKIVWPDSSKNEFLINRCVLAKTNLSFLVLFEIKLMHAYRVVLGDPEVPPFWNSVKSFPTTSILDTMTGGLSEVSGSIVYKRPANSLSDQRSIFHKLSNIATPSTPPQIWIRDVTFTGDKCWCMVFVRILAKCFHLPKMKWGVWICPVICSR